MEIAKLSRISLISAIAWNCAVATGLADVMVTGTVYGVDSQGQYQPASGVTVQAFRQGGPVFPTPPKTGSDGTFKLNIPSGLPFTVTFYGNASVVPELQELAGVEGSRDSVCVSLTTVEQYQKLASAGLVMPLKSKLECS